MSAFSSSSWVDKLSTARMTGSVAQIPAPELDLLERKQALGIQEEMLERLYARVAGWKVAILADGDVIAAPIIAERMFASPATLAASIYGLGGIECEIAFLMAKTPVPSRGRHFTGSDIASCIGGAMAAIEVLDSRLPAGLKSPRNAMVADFLGNGALVVGDVVENWQDRPFGDRNVTLSCNGDRMLERRGGHASGDLVGWIAALATHLSERGRVIDAGQIVTTGSHTGVEFGKAGDVLTCRFHDLPSVSVTFAQQTSTDQSVGNCGHAGR